METSPKSLISLPSFLNSPLFFFFFITLTFLFFLSKKRKLSAGNLPPSPPALPIIGNLHQLGKMPHLSLWELSKKYGPVMLLKLGQIPTIVVSSPEMAEHVLKTNDLKCCSRPNSYGTNKLSYNFVDLAFCPYNEYWKEMRKLFVVELFTVKRVQSFSYIRDVEVSKLIDFLYQNEGKSINLIERIFHISNEIICQIAFGKSYEGNQYKSTKLQEVLNDCFAVMSGFWAADFFPTFGWIIDKFTGLHKKLDKAFANLDEFLERVIEEHLQLGQENSKHKDIVEILLGLSMDQTCSVRLTRDHIKALLMNIILGGVDAGSITVAWAMMRHCKIGGYDVFPKTRVLVGTWAIGRDPHTWKDPDEFYPERFEDNVIDFRGADFELLPFGAGRRICPGITMAVTTIELMLANMLYCFDWELPPGMKIEDISMEEEGGLTVHKKLPLYLVPIKYKWVE